MEKSSFSNDGNFDNIRSILALLVGIVATALLLLLYGWAYSVFHPDVSGAYSGLASFVSARFDGQSWAGRETGALVLTLAILGGGVAGGWFIWRKIRHGYKAWRSVRVLRSRYTSSQGTAEFGSYQDLAPLLGKDGVAVGYHHKKPVRLSERASCEHLAIIGPTGCGKTSRFFIPNLFDLPDGASAVVTDPKGEIEQTVRQRLEQRGWSIRVFSIERPESSVSYNPIAIAKDATEISELSEIILVNGYSSSGAASDTQWVNFSQPLWEAAILGEMKRAEVEKDLPLVSSATRFVTDHSEEERARFFSLIGGKARDKYNAYAQSIQSPETSSSIRAVLTSSVKIFSRDDVQAVVEGGDVFYPMELREKPTVFFIQIPERKTNLLKPLSATLYWQLLEHIATSTERPVFFMLDEFPNLGQIPGFAQTAATMRSRKLSISIGLQGVEQLSREYSPEEQKDILNNMKTKIYFPGSTGDSGEYTSQLSGYSTTRVSGGGDTRRELLTADELRRLPEGYVMILAHNLNPVLLESIPWFKQKRYTQNKKKQAG